MKTRPFLYPIAILLAFFTSTVIGEELDNDNNKKLVAYNNFLHQLANLTK